MRRRENTTNTSGTERCNRLGLEMQHAHQKCCHGQAGRVLRTNKNDEENDALKSAKIQDTDELRKRQTAMHV